MILGACEATIGTRTRTWLFFVLLAAADAPAAALPPATFAAAAPRMALTIWAVPGSSPLRLLISASFRAPATAPEAKPAPVIWAHDTADDRVHGNLSSAPVVLHIVGESECLLTENGGKFLPLLDLLFVKDSVELVECILCVTAEGRDILRRILPDVDGSRCNGNFYCKKCIALRILFLLLLQFLLSEAFFQRLRYFIQIFDDILFLAGFCSFETSLFSSFSLSPQL